MATIDLFVEHGLAYDSSLMGHDYRRTGAPR